MKNTFEQHSDSLLDYTVDWSEWLDAGDTINTSTWSAPADLTLSGEAHTSTAATAFLTGGTPGQSYEVTNRITTDAGRTSDPVTLVFRIK